LAANPEKRRYSFEQYKTLLQNNDQRLEYDHGDIYALAGSSANHAAISANMWRALDDALGNTPCVDIWLIVLYASRLMSR
jgi:Uma2 family endonuclease